jgi:hypothetical protein
MRLLAHVDCNFLACQTHKDSCSESKICLHCLLPFADLLQSLALMDALIRSLNILTPKVLIISLMVGTGHYISENQAWCCYHWKRLQHRSC